MIGTRTSTKQEAIDFEVALHARTRLARLHGRVHFLGTRSDIPRLFGEVTVLIHAARQEPLGRVMLEAAASGVPVVATDVGGTREIFPTGCGAALLVDGTRDESELISGLSSHVRRILSDSSLHAELSAAARRRAEAAFSATHAAERLMAALSAGKARHLGPVARVVMKIANGSGGCGVVLQHRMPGFFAPASRGGGRFSGRRIGCPGGWYTIRPLPREESRLSACGFRAGTPRKKPGFRAKPGIWDRRPGW